MRIRTRDELVGYLGALEDEQLRRTEATVRRHGADDAEVAVELEWIRSAWNEKCRLILKTFDLARVDPEAAEHPIQ